MCIFYVMATLKPLFGNQTLNAKSTASVLYKLKLMSSWNTFIESTYNKRTWWFVTVSINVSVYRGNEPNKKAHHMVWQILGIGPEMTNVLSQ